MLVPLPINQIEVDLPVPVAIWDAHGKLLLRSGDVVRNEKELELLCLHGPHVRADDYKAWIYGYTTRLDQMVRENRSLQDIARTRLPADFRPPSADEALDTDPVQAWPDLHNAVTLLQRQSTDGADLFGRLGQLERRMLHLIESDPDRALFMLVQQLQDTTVGYCAIHAMASASVATLIARGLDIPATEHQTLRRAALTMNIGISRLLDELSASEGSPLPAQQIALQEHPLRSMLLLHRLGVTDPDWLDLVRDHHEMPDGSGFPARKRQLPLLQQVLRLADIMCEHLSHRKGVSTGGGQFPPAAKALLLDDSGQPSPLGTAYLRALGIHPPGAFVSLANGELAVVVRRGIRANAPRVLSLIGRHGMPLGEPIPRDTSDPVFEVKGTLPRNAVRVLIDPTKLLARI